MPPPSSQRRFGRMTPIAILLCFLSLAAAQNIRAGSDPVPLLLAAASGIRPCYSFDGKGNNVNNPDWGSVGEELVRPEGNSYKGSWHFPRTGPNARTVSNVMSHHTCTDSDRTAEVCINDWFWLWGQMVDHDITHVPTFPKSVENSTMSVTVPTSDPFLSGRTLPMRRSAVTENSEQINLATSYLDLSLVYGVSEAAANRVRARSGGRLLATQDGFPPVIPARLRMDHSETPTFGELGHPSFRDQFLCADMRCNQHAPMASLQTMFIREHNRIATALANARHPAYRTDEAIYQAARAMVIAQAQSITYREFLPLLMSRFGVAPYTGYKPDVPASISNAFNTAGFRTSHSMVRCDFREMTGQGQTLRAVNFATSFFDSTWLRGPPAQPNRAGREQNAYQTVMNALAHNPSARMGHRVSPALRSVLFAPSATAQGEPVPSMAFDVIATDVERGRDHGLLDYRSMRRAQGWGDVRTAADITADRNKQAILMSLYPEIDDIDLFAGMMLEDPLDGALTGPVTTSVVRDQFERLRDGDRCWFENQFQGQLLAMLRNVRLRDLVDRNFNNPPAVATFNSDGVQTTETDEGFSLFGAPERPQRTFSSHGDDKDGKDKKEKKDKKADKKKKKDESKDEGKDDDKPHHHHAGPHGGHHGGPRGSGMPEIDLRSWHDRELSLGRSPDAAAVAAAALPPARPAEAVDDVVGYRCTGSNVCEPITLDEPLDPEVIAIAREIRDRRRAMTTAGVGATTAPLQQEQVWQGVPMQPMQQQQQHMMHGHQQQVFAAGAGMLPLQQQQQGYHTMSHSMFPHSHPVFATLRTHAHAHSPVLSTADPTSQSLALSGGLAHPAARSGAAFTTLQFLPPGFPGAANNNANAAPAIRNLSPAPGIMQNANRAALPIVSPATLVENIFLTPQCRR